MRRNAFLFSALFTVFLAPAWASAGFINFDDGDIFFPVDTTYTASQGVTFSGGAFDTNFGQPGTSGALGLNSEFFSYAIPPANPIIITFTNPQSLVSIMGFDVGQAGVRMNAYDSTSGGSLVGTDDYFGVGIGDMFSSTTLSVSAPLISRIELFQPFDAQLDRDHFDGTFFDNLSFTAGSITATPEPSSFALLTLTALPLLQISRRRRARQTAAS